MKLFGQLVRTVVNVATIPVALTKDVVTLGNVMGDKSFTEQLAQRIKDEADE